MSHHGIATRTIVWLDHSQEGVDQVSNGIGSAIRNQKKDRMKVSEAFRFIGIIVRPGDNLVHRAKDAIIENCSGYPDLVLVDLNFEDEHQSESSIDVGRGLALDLMDQMPVKVGVYTRLDLSPLRRAQLTSDGLALVLEHILIAYDGPKRLTGDQWSDLFDKIINKADSVIVQPPETLIRIQTAVQQDPHNLPTLHKALSLPRMADKLTPDQILIAMRPKDCVGLYVLGSFDKRITFYAQQVRALTLVRALFEGKDLRAGQRVAVIGGGAAGITAAVASATKGCETHLYERRDSILYLQKESAHRFLHPHIYDWPEEWSTETDAGLPLLNWSAAYANELATNLRRQASQFRDGHTSLFKIHTDSKIKELEQTGQRDKRIRILGNEGRIDDEFHVVIIAIGYGLDENPPSTTSYWSPDSITGSHEKEKLAILVSGSGDGGLIDLARATLQDFRHDNTLNQLTGLKTLGHAMKDIDERALLEQRRGGKAINLLNEYEKLTVEPSIVAKIRTMKRNDTDVTFNYRSPGVFSLNSALINRLLGFLLLKAEIVKPKYGAINAEKVKPVDAGRYRVAFNGEEDTCDFDLVILRHGPPREYFDRRFPNLAVNCSELGGKLAEIGLTGTLTHETYNWYQND